MLSDNVLHERLLYAAGKQNSARRLLRAALRVAVFDLSADRSSFRRRDEIQSRGFFRAAKKYAKISIC